MRKNLTCLENLGITADDMYSMLQSRNIELEKRDLYPYTFPSQLDVKNSKIKPIYLGNYINWNYQKQVKLIQKELDWEGDELEGVPDRGK